jgi:nucleoside-diphosphate-sugar epimerase
MIMSKNKSVLVTGSCGYIGSELIDRLQADKVNYLGFDKLNSDLKQMLCLDMCDRASTVRTIRQFLPDRLVHCGTHSALAYKNNFLESFSEDAAALINILNSLKELPSTRLIFFSSSYVYSGIDTNITIKETSLLKPTHNFGLAKSFFEQLVFRNHPNSVAFRLASVFGPGKAQHPNAVENMAKESLAQNQLTVWGLGKRKMQYVYIEDVIEHIISAFSIEPGIYNLGANEYTCVGETAGVIAELCNSKLIFLKDKKEGESLPFMDNASLKKVSKKDFTPLALALEKYLKVLRKNKK